MDGSVAEWAFTSCDIGQFGYILSNGSYYYSGNINDITSYYQATGTFI